MVGGAYEPGTYDPHNIHWRATTVSAELVERLAQVEGLSCIGQETVAWGNETLLNDCFSVIARAESRRDRENVVVQNLDFTREEIAVSRRISAHYPPPRSGLSYRAEERAERRHADADALAAPGDSAGARTLLRAELREAIDPEALNDLAVLAHRCGDDDEALALLRALVHLHPEHSAAVTNLSALEARCGYRAAPAPTVTSA
jgi:hypothetical protein